MAQFKVPLEIPVFFLLFSFMISGTITGNLVIFRTCYATLGYNKSECALLGTKYPDNETQNLEKLVQPYSAVINMVSALTENLASVFICLFVGPWSDRFGRKPMLILPVAGHLISNVSLSIFSVIESASPWFLLLCHLPLVLTGGSPSYFTVLLCYITDLTNESNRGMRMATIEGAIFLGIFLGTVSSSYIFYATGYAFVFLIAAACCFLNLILTLFFIPESLTNLETEGRFKGLFQISNLTDMLKVTFKKRENYNRCIILLCLLMTMLGVLSNGDSVMYLFLRQKFHWSLQKYTLFSAVNSIISVIGTILGVYVLHKLLKIHENVLILVGMVSGLAGALIMGFAQIDWVVYTAAAVRNLSGISGPMLQSMVSKVIPTSETGKVLALLIAFQFLFQIVATPLYTTVYNSTISTDPGIYNFVSAGFDAVLILVAIGIIVIRKKESTEDYNHLVEEDLGGTQADAGTVVNT